VLGTGWISQPIRVAVLALVLGVNILGCSPLSEGQNCSVVGVPASIGSSLSATMTVRSGQQCVITVTPQVGTPHISKKPAHGIARAIPAPRSGVAYMSERGYIGRDAFQFFGPEGASVNVDVEVVGLPTAVEPSRPEKVISPASPSIPSSSGAAEKQSKQR